MVVRDEDRLAGVVEIGHTLIGGRPPTGCSQERHPPLVGVAVEVGSSPGSYRAMLGRLSERSAAGIAAFVAQTVEPGSVVLTELWADCGEFPACGHTYQPSRGRDEGGSGSAAIPEVHAVVGLLKRSLLRTYQSSVSSAQLDHYLREFTFRFNQRGSPPGARFRVLLEGAVATAPISYRALIGATR